MAKPAKRIKSAAAAYVPQNRDAVITDIKRIGDLQREASRLETEMNDAIAEITEKFAARIMALPFAGSFPIRKVRQFFPASRWTIQKPFMRRWCVPPAHAVY